MAFGKIGFAQISLNGFNPAESTNTYGLGVKFQKEISIGTGRLYLDLDFAFRYEHFENVIFVKDKFASNESIVPNGFNIALFTIDVPIQGAYEVKNTLNLERYFIDVPINLKYFFASDTWILSLNGDLHPSFTLFQSGNIDGQMIQNDTIVLSIDSKLELYSSIFNILMAGLIREMPISLTLP